MLVRALSFSSKKNFDETIRRLNGNLKPEQKKNCKLDNDGSDHRQIYSGAKRLKQIEEEAVILSDNPLTVVR